jgi:aspartate 1-decarboxylase
MFRVMCKSKIHRATITKADLHYEGSIGIDKLLLEAADIRPGEMVQVVNVTNGARFETYAIEEAPAGGTIALYGAAAHLGKSGDLVIILSSALIEDARSSGRKVRVVHVDSHNRIHGPIKDKDLSRPRAARKSR